MSRSSRKPTTYQIFMRRSATRFAATSTRARSRRPSGIASYTRKSWTLRLPRDISGDDLAKTLGPVNKNGTAWSRAKWRSTCSLIARTPVLTSNRQGEDEHGSLAQLALDPYSPPVQLHELLGQCQPE